jgi:hypothetical protein
MRGIARTSSKQGKPKVSSSRSVFDGETLKEFRETRRWRDVRWLSSWHGRADGWSGNPRYGPPSGYGWLGRRIYERTRDLAACQRQLFDAATPEQLAAAREWLVEVNREHEAQDASLEEVFHAIERQYQPGGWVGFVNGLGNLRAAK